MSMQRGTFELIQAFPSKREIMHEDKGIVKPTRVCYIADAKPARSAARAYAAKRIGIFDARYLNIPGSSQLYFTLISSFIETRPSRIRIRHRQLIGTANRALIHRAFSCARQAESSISINFLAMSRPRVDRQESSSSM